MKKVSVYIITQNRAELAKRAILSVFEQTYKNIEVIVVDDASKDTTSEMIAELQKKYPITYFKNSEVKGACFSRNVAINNATGEFITGMDDDDYFSPERIATLLEHYNDDYAFICANILEVTKEAKTKRSFGFTEGEFTLKELLHHNLVGNQMLTKTEKLRSIGGFDESFPAFQDYDTWVRLVAKFGKALKIPDANYCLETDHGGERISSSNTRKHQGFLLFVEKHKDKMSKEHLKSMNILELKVQGKPLSFIDMLKNINCGNYRSALSLFKKSFNGA